MEQIVASMVNLGIGGTMAAAVLWFLFRMTQHTIPDLLDKQREDQNAARADFREAMKERDATFKDAVKEINAAAREAQTRIEARWQAATDALCTRLEALGGRMEALDRHAKSNENNIRVLTEWVSQMQKSQEKK